METTPADPCFVDTNILLAATDTDWSAHSRSRVFLTLGLSGKLRLFACGQIFREYLVVATRPLENNGLGLTPQKAIENIESFHQCLQLLEENDATTRRLESLVAKNSIKGKRIHDANLVSIMIENGLSEIITLNPKDFTAFSEITPREP